MKYILIFLLLLVPSSVYAFTYENKDLNIRMEIPDDRVYREYSLPEIIFSKLFAVQFIPSSEVRFDNTEEFIDSPIYVMVMEDTEVPYQNMNLELYKEYWEQTKELKGSRFEEILIGEENISANQMNYESNNTRNTIQIIFINDSKPYVLSYVANNDIFKKFLPVFQNITKSIEFIN